MRTFTCLLAFSFFFCFSAHCQKKWGIDAGINFSTVTGYQGLGVETGSLVSLQASFFGMLPVHKSLYFNPSIGLLPKGITFKKVNVTDGEGNDLGNATLHRRFNYLQLSLPFAYKLPVSKKTYGFAGVGLYLAYAVSGTTSVSDFVPFETGTPKPASESINFKTANINRFDAGIVFHFSFVSSHHWCAGANFDFGLSKINSSQNAIVARNQNYGFTVGYIL